MPAETATELSMMYVTAPTEAWARQMARKLVSMQLAACVNILAGQVSVYMWEGKLCEDQEYVLLVKTTRASVPAVRAAIADEHPYSTPCILEWGLDSANESYGAWVKDACAGSKS